MSTAPPLVAHIIYRLDTGGLENGLANLINAMPPDAYRHAIVCLDDFTDFRLRIRRTDVEIVALHKRPGNDWMMYKRLLHVLRRLRPALVHTRNFCTLDAQLVALAAGVRARVHGEHGRDVFDLDGNNRKYNIVRRTLRPLVDAYIAVSSDLAQWLRTTVGIPETRVFQIYNGVDCSLFHPKRADGCGARDLVQALPGRFVIGTVGRMAIVKDQVTLVDAFIELVQRRPDLRGRVGLALVGDGPLRAECIARLDAASLRDEAWVPGERHDVPSLMAGFDLFVLPSIAEGISNTVLEAMASGLPVVATAVGGNRELVAEDVTGRLVCPKDVISMSRAMESYCDNPLEARRHGEAGRSRVEARFSLQTMTESYRQLYCRVLRQTGTH